MQQLRRLSFSSPCIISFENWLLIVILFLFCCLCIYCMDASLLPDNVGKITTRHLFKNAIAANYYEVMMRLYSKTYDICIASNHIRVSSVLLFFPFNVSECSWHWKPTGKNSKRSLNILVSCWSLRCSSSKSLSSINTTSSSLDPFFFLLIIWSMIFWNRLYFIPAPHWENCSRVPYICTIHHVLNNKHYICAWPWPFNRNILSPISHILPMVAFNDV